MKIDVDGEEVPVEKEKKPEPIAVVTVPPSEPSAYKPDQVNINQGDWNSVYQPEVFEYARKYGYFIVPTIAEALKQRSEGKKVMTAREADTACRGSVDLNSALLIEAYKHSMIVEDYAGHKTSVFELRNFYNQKLKFLQGQITAEDTAKVRGQMHKLLWVLAEARVPAYPIEEKEGFHPELCKPDYMSWQQYYDKVKNDPAPSTHDWEAILKAYEQHTQR